MADTTFVNFRTPTIEASWLNDVNALRYGASSASRGAALLEFVGPDGAVSDVRTKLLQWVTPQDFGALGDGTTDDTTALAAALASGYPIDFTGATFRITAPLLVTVSGVLRWRSNGATILADFADAQQSAVVLTLGLGTHNVVGPLHLAANSKAFNGWVFDTAVAADLDVEGLSVSDVYRESLDYSGGNGILLTGPFNRVRLERPTVKNCRMAASAGVSGSEGIFGISALFNAQGSPDHLFIINPFIDTVWCEDDTWLFDQDGIRTLVNNDAGDATIKTLSVEGGLLRNCYGRGVKSQCEVSSVIGTKFIRTAGFARGYGNEEIDFQEGGGLIKDVQCIYDGSAPEFVVQMQSSRVAKNLCSAVVDSVHVQLGTGTTLTRFLTTVPFDTGTGQLVRVSNVSIAGDGELTLFAAFYGGYDEEFHLFLSDISAAPTTRFVSPLLRGTGDASGSVRATRVVNTGASEIQFMSQNLTDPANWECVASLTDCVGFEDNIRGQSLYNETAAGAGHQAIRAIIMEGAKRSGTLRPVSFTLADNGLYTIASGTCVSGNASNALLVAVSDADKESQGLFFAGDDGVLKGTTATNWEVSTSTSEPGSGSYRLWRDSGLNFRNASGAERTFTLLLVG